MSEHSFVYSEKPIRIERGEGQMKDLDLMMELATSMGAMPGTTICGLADGAWMSSKKDHLVNIGGWVAVEDEDRAAAILHHLADRLGIPYFIYMTGMSSPEGPFVQTIGAEPERWSMNRPGVGFSSRFAPSPSSARFSWAAVLVHWPLL